MKNRVFLSTLTLFFAFASLNAQEDKAGKIVTDYYASVDAGNFDAALGLLTDGFTSIAPFSPKPFDRMSWRGVGEGFKAAFPNMKHEITNWFAKGNSVAVQAIFKGTNTGPMMGNPPTGNKVAVPFTAIITLDGNGKIKSLDTRFDQKDFEAQLMAGLPDPKAVAEKNIRSLFAAMDAGQTEKFQDFCTTDFMITHPFLPAPQPIAVFQGIIQGQKAGFPDMKHEITEFFTDGEKAAVRGIFKGTNTGPMQGNPPTNNEVTLPFTVTYDLDNQGKIKHQYVSFDTASFNNQLMAGTATQGKQ
jgi:predicted ester cyclase